MKKKWPILEIGINILLIIITFVIMNYPINITTLEFWLFIMLAFFECVVVILISRFIKKKKKMKKIDKKYLEKINQTKLIIIFSLSIILVIALSIMRDILVDVYDAKNIYPESIENLEYHVISDDKKVSIPIPSYSVYLGTNWGELMRFYSPKNASQLKSEIENILNSDEFIKYETEFGNYYYNEQYDYTITGYDVFEGLAINSFNYVFCNGLCVENVEK